MEKVRVKDCPVHEEGHSVLLHSTLPLEGGLAAQQVREDVLNANPPANGKKRTEAEIERVGQLLSRKWFLVFVEFGAYDWDLCDGEGNPVPFDVSALLNDYALSHPVAERANDLYGEAVLAPFRQAPQARSPAGSTDATTPADPTPIRLPSRRSSRATSAASRRSAG